MDEITARPNEPAGAAARARAETDGPSDVSIFPLAMPLIAGPGAITSVMLMMGRARGDYAAQGTILAMLLVVLVITYLAFLSATRLNRWMGPTFGEVLTRLLGIILAAVGVEYMVGGLRGVWISLGG
jgi:multiple antibiotic resistance protein